MPSLIERLTGKRVEQDNVPVCPDHDVPMRLRGKVGRPARFHDQTGSEYTLIFVCPENDCANSESRSVRRIQAAIPGNQPARPLFSRVNDK